MRRRAGPCLGSLRARLVAGNLGAESGATAARAFDVETPTECLDPVGETDKTGAVPGVCSSDAVVYHDDGDGAV